MRPLAEFLAGEMGGWIEEDIVFHAKATASAMGMPDQFVDGIAARRVSKYHWQLYNSWWGENYHTGKVDVPLARFFESGTRRHLVLPVYKKALSWTVTYGGKSFPQASRVRGEATFRFFSRGHYVSGIGARQPMARAFRRGMRALKARIEREAEIRAKLMRQFPNA